jgi:hypothetical protein
MAAVYPKLQQHLGNHQARCATVCGLDSTHLAAHIMMSFTKRNTVVRQITAVVHQLPVVALQLNTLYVLH